MLRPAAANASASKLILLIDISRGKSQIVNTGADPEALQALISDHGPRERSIGGPTTYGRQQVFIYIFRSASTSDHY